MEQEVLGISLSLKKWSQDVGCKRCKNVEEEVWVRLVGLPAHLWSRKVLRKIGDCCGGFLAVDEDTAFLIDLKWARIKVKWGGRDLLRLVEMTCGSFCFLIQLWWEVSPCLDTEFTSRRLVEEKIPRGEEGEEGAHAGGRVRTSLRCHVCCLKEHEGFRRVASKGPCNLQSEWKD